MTGSVEVDAAEVERLERWRTEASRLGGLPQEHPDVPSEYVYMANRMVHLIDGLTRVAPPAETAGALDRLRELLDRTEADARERQHLARLSVREIREYVFAPGGSDG